jgi:hypothetical protein
MAKLALFSLIAKDMIFKICKDMISPDLATEGCLFVWNKIEEGG